MTGADGDLSTIILLFVLAGLVAFALFGPRNSSASGAVAVPDGPEDQPYRAYTDAFDLELPADLVLQMLPHASLDRERGFLQGNLLTVKAATARTGALVRAYGHVAEDRLAGLRSAMGTLDPDEVAVALLIDQSGSMKGERIAHAAATAEIVTRALCSLGVRNEVLGFSTAGWQGGKAYEEWKAAGRPPRPGRLCALLHVVYKAADEPALTAAARDTMTHPDILRENVDGEAVLWARDRLLGLLTRHRLLIVMSDGAPVDDATLTHNGPSLLHRHIIKVVAEVEAASVVIGGVGVNHEVSLYYPRSRAALELDDLPATTMDVLEDLLGVAASA